MGKRFELPGDGRGGDMELIITEVEQLLDLAEDYLDPTYTDELLQTLAEGVRKRIDIRKYVPDAN